MRPFNSIYGLVHLVHQTSLSPLCRVRVACWRAQSNNSFVLHSTVDQGSKPNLSAASNLLRSIFWLIWTLGPSPRKSSYLRIFPERRVVLACYAPSPTHQSTEALCRIYVKGSSSSAGRSSSCSLSEQDPAQRTACLDDSAGPYPNALLYFPPATIASLVADVRPLTGCSWFFSLPLRSLHHVFDCDKASAPRTLHLGEVYTQLLRSLFGRFRGA